MAGWDNFVQTQLATIMSTVSTSVDIDAATAPWTSPPTATADNPVYITLVDNLQNPNKFEIISYTGRTGSGPYTLTGITRGLEGTSAQTWAIGDYVIQDLTAAQVIDTHELASSNGNVTLDGGTF